jgi:hypothetical protein
VVSSRRYPLELREQATLNAGEPAARLRSHTKKSPDIPGRFMLSCAKGRGVALITRAVD